MLSPSSRRNSLTAFRPPFSRGSGSMATTPPLLTRRKNVAIAVRLDGYDAEVNPRKAIGSDCVIGSRGYRLIETSSTGYPLAISFEGAGSGFCDLHQLPLVVESGSR